MSRSPVRIRSVAPKENPRKLACEADFRGFLFVQQGMGKWAVVPSLPLFIWKLLYLVAQEVALRRPDRYSVPLI